MMLEASPSLRFLPVGALLLFAAVGCGDDAPAIKSGAGASSATSGAGGLTGAGGGPSTSSGEGASSTVGSGATGSGASGPGGTGPGGSGSGGSGTGVVRFVATGDVGKGNQGQLDVANAIADKCMIDGCDFVQLLGDNIYDSGVSSTSDPQWQEKFEVPYAAVDLPFWAVLGNHDYGANGTGSDFEKGQHEIDYTMVSTKWKMPAAYHQRSVQHVDIFSLDTNMAMFDQADQQKTDVAAWLAASNATWKLAMGHHTYLSNGPHGNAGEYEGLPFVPIVNGAGVKDLMDTTICGKVDVYFCGHDHSLQLLTDKCGGTTSLFVSGAGASTTEFEGDNATEYQTLDLSFLYVRIEDNVMTVEVVDTMGNVGFTHTITK